MYNRWLVPNTKDCKNRGVTMLSIIFIITSTIFFMLLMSAILFTLFGKQIRFDKKLESYFHTSITSNNEQKVADKNNEKRTEVLQKYWKTGIAQISKKSSKRELKKLDSLLRDAGYFRRLSALEFRLIQLLISVGGALSIIIIITPIAEQKEMVGFLAVAVGFLGYRYPVFFMGKRKTARIKEINKEMPDFFDMVNLLLEAGVSLDAAILTVCEKKKNTLAEEFGFALDDMKRGKSRREAFYELKLRVPSNELQSILTSLIQADQLGVGMGKVINSLTTRVREQRREAAREQAMKAPVKMLFPMVFLIFPSLFIVILGPMVIQLLTGGLSS